MARALALLVTGALLAAGLTGCTSTQESYCSTLKDDQKQLRTLVRDSGESGGRGTKALRGTVKVFAELRDAAPDDVRGNWGTLVDAFRELVDAIDASGADPGDFAGGKRPDGVTEGQLRAVQRAAAGLQSTSVQQAGKSIEQHAHDVCKVDLGSELGGGG